MMLRKRFKKAKGKVNKIPLNVLRKHKGQRRTRPQVSKELITVQTSFCEYQNAKALTKETDDTAQYEEIDDTSFHDDSLPVSQSYLKRKMKAAERWEEVRSGIQKIILHKNSLDKDTVCFNCKKSPAVMRCHQCSPFLYCMDCNNRFHHNRNFHHCPEIWKVYTCMCV